MEEVGDEIFIRQKSLHFFFRFEAETHRIKTQETQRWVHHKGEAQLTVRETPKLQTAQHLVQQRDQPQLDYNQIQLRIFQLDQREEEEQQTQQQIRDQDNQEWTQKFVRS